MVDNKIRSFLTFDDVLLVPNYSEIIPRDTDTSVRISKKIKLNIPLLSSPMDTVTGAKFAIALASEGGIGVIHRNMTIKEQVAEVCSVKNFESGVIRNPVCVSAEQSVSDVLDYVSKYGFSSFPVLDKDRKLVGIITNRDMRFVNDVSVKVGELMSTDVVTVDRKVSVDEAKDILHTQRIEKLPIVDSFGKLEGMITVRDLLKSKSNPFSCKDLEGKLCVGAAVGSMDQDRVDALCKAGVDIIVVDTAHGHSKNVLESVKFIKKNYDVDVIGGNVVTASGAQDLVSAGADCVKVGVGPGSICTTRVVSGVGVPQISAVMDCCNAVSGSGVSVISDGGVKFSGDIGKAIVAGADAVMLGSMFAGCNETPGRVVYMNGRKYKTYRGMGSVGAMIDGSKSRYFQDSVANDKLVPEGVEGIVPYKGSLEEVVFQIIGGFKSAMGYCGAKTIPEMKKKGKFIKVSSAGLKESHPHDIKITDEAPNYRLRS